MGGAGEKFSKFENFYAFSGQNFEFLSQNLDIFPKVCNFNRPKSILQSIDDGVLGIDIIQGIDDESL